MTVEYDPPVARGDGWWFKRTVNSAYEVWFGPYPDENNCNYNLERMRRNDVLGTGAGLQQNLYENLSWRQTIRDIFGPTSIEAYPPRGSRG